MLPSMPRRPLVVAATILCFCLGSSALLAVADAKENHHTWNILYQQKSPDCVEKLAVTVNGQAPGPTIRATQGDTIVVTVNNKLEIENTAIHSHGIRQIDTPWADGVAGVTQCPIQPGETFTYRFIVDRAGTYLYHSHYGMQRVDGLNGMIVVTRVPEGVRKPFTNDEEHTILLEDWWHKSVYDQATGLSAKTFQFVGEPQSLLINGRGMFNFSKLAADHRQRNMQQHPSGLRIAYSVHRRARKDIPPPHWQPHVTLIAQLRDRGPFHEGCEADGHYVRPFVVRNLFIYSGETYSVLVKADQDPRRNYWAVSNMLE